MHIFQNEWAPNPPLRYRLTFLSSNEQRLHFSRCVLGASIKRLRLRHFVGVPQLSTTSAEVHTEEPPAIGLALQLIAAHLIDDGLESIVDSESSLGHRVLSNRFSTAIGADCAAALGESVETFALRVIGKRAELTMQERQAIDAASPEQAFVSSDAHGVVSSAGVRARGEQSLSSADATPPAGADSPVRVLSLAQSVPEELAAELVRRFGVRGAFAFAAASNRLGPVNLRRNAIVRRIRPNAFLTYRMPRRPIRAPL